MAIYYIKNGGNNSLNGLSDENAWETIAKINSFTFTAGDTISFKCNSIWRETLIIPRSGSTNNHIIFNSYSTGEKPKIYGSFSVNTWSNTFGNIWEASLGVNPWVCEDTNSSVSHAEIFFNENEVIKWGLHKTDTSTLLNEYDWTWLSNKLYVYATSNPDSRYISIEAPLRSEGIRYNDKNYITIDNLEIKYVQAKAIGTRTYPHPVATNLTITNCNISYVGYKNSDSAIGISGEYSNLIIQNCEIHDIGRRGISIAPYNNVTTNNILIENCIFYNGHHTTGPDIECIAGGEFTGNISNVIIRNNLLYESSTGTGVTHLMFIQDYSGGGNLSGLTIYNNIFEYPINNALQLEAINGAMIYNNTFYGHNQINTVSGYFILLDAGCNNIDIKNNIFYGNVDLEVSYYTFDIYLGSGTFYSDINVNYNLHYNTDINNDIIFIDSTHRYNISEWDSLKSYSGWEINSPILTDPSFWAGSPFVYHLKTNSPAIHTGIDVSIIYDKNGLLYSNPPSIGAYEYLNSSTYFIKTDGNDSANGLSDVSAWKTVNRVRPAAPYWFAPNPGDQILFKRGDTWRLNANEALRTGSNGSTGYQITFGAYGTGDNPLFTGFETISSWTNDGSGIYSKTVTTEAQTSEYNNYVVTLDGSSIAMGRYPQTNWLTYEQATYNTSIVDYSLNSASTNWTGAEAVIKRVRWMTNRHSITNHTGQTLTFISGNTGWDFAPGNGYFIQNDLKTLTYLGAWHYNPSTSKLSMYFGVENPDNHIVKISTINTGIWDYYTNYHTYENLTVEGLNYYGLRHEAGQHNIIQNCEFRFIVGFGILGWPYASYQIDSSYNGPLLNVHNNYIHNCGTGGIHLTGYNYYYNDDVNRITNNVVSDIGMFYGGSIFQVDDNWGDSIYDQHLGSIIEHNTVINSGHNGISIKNGDKQSIKNNYVDGYGFTRYDAGGIYIWNSHGADVSGHLIKDNIALNGNPISVGLGGYGTDSSNLSLWGIYLDEHSDNCIVEGNTSVNNPTGGVQLALLTGVTLANNTLYNNGNQLDMHSMWFTELIRDCSISNNIFFAKDSSQFCLRYNSQMEDFNQIGYVDNNYYIRPVEDTSTIKISVMYANPSTYTLEGWRIASGEDTNSHKSPIITTNNNFYFRYNASDASLNITFDGSSYIDARGTMYNDNIILSPWSSTILMEYGYAEGSIYYVSSDGSDNQSGKSDASAWRTIAKVNATTFAPGDAILFKKGDTFTGTLAITNSGTSGNHITISSYGTGNKPVIYGFTTVSSWTSVDGSVYKSNVSVESSTNNIVTVNGVNTAMGRWPNTGWRTYTSYSGSTYIRDSSLTGTPNWTGAELVFRKSNWTLERSRITNHDVSTLYYNSFSDWGLTNGMGYFIQNDLKTLDTIGDWYYDSSTLYMYFGSASPSDYVIKISTLNSLITSGVPNYTHYDYITVDDVAFEGSSLATVDLVQNTHHWTIQDCSFNLAGKNCIDGRQLVHNLLIANNTINNSNNSAIRSIYQGYNNTVTRNNINNTGVLLGMMYSDDEGGDAIVLKDMNTGSNIDTVTYNTITNTGHLGVKVRYQGYYVANNYIDNFAVTKNDAGGLYTWGVSNVVFKSNIVLNGNGQSGGVGSEPSFAPPDPYFVNVVGIYLDEITNTVDILENTTAGNRDGGIFVQMSSSVNIINNTSYDNGWFQLALLQRTAATDPVRNVSMNDNIFFSKSVGRALFPYMQLCMYAQSWEANTDINQFGRFDNNYYVRPIDQLTNADTFTVYEHNPASPWNGTLMNLSGWNTISGQDANSHSTTMNVDSSNYWFRYATDTSVVLSFDGSAYIDAKGTIYNNSLTVSPWKSMILIPYGSSTPDSSTRIFLTSSNGKLLVVGNYYITI